MWKEVTGRDSESTENAAGELAPVPAITDFGAQSSAGVAQGPTGPGWIIELDCYHYYTDIQKDRLYARNNHVRKLMTTAFLEGEVNLPIGKDEEGHEQFEKFTTAEMGLSLPMLVEDGTITIEPIPLPESEIEESEVGPERPAAGGLSALGGGLGSDASNDSSTIKKPTSVDVERLDFKFQIVWQEKLLNERLEKKEEDRKKAEENAANATDDDLANSR